VLRQLFEPSLALDVGWPVGRADRLLTIEFIDHRLRS
jgi:hypothetical protein